MPYWKSEPPPSLEFTVICFGGCLGDKILDFVHIKVADGHRVMGVILSRQFKRFLNTPGLGIGNPRGRKFKVSKDGLRSLPDFQVIPEG